MKTYYVIFTYVQNDRVYSHNAINVCAESPEEAKESIKSLFVDSCEEFMCNEVCEVVDSIRKPSEVVDVRYITFIDSAEDIPNRPKYADMIDDGYVFGIPVEDIPWGKTIIVPLEDFKEWNYSDWSSFEFPLQPGETLTYRYPEWIIKNIRRA